MDIELTSQLSKLRKIVHDSGSSELRQLESQLLQSYVNKKNKKLIEEKKKQTNAFLAKDKEYCNLNKELDRLHIEERDLQESIRKNEAALLSLYQQEQSIDHAVDAAENKCYESLVSLALQPDTHKIEQEKIRAEIDRKKRIKDLTDILQRQKKHAEALHELQGHILAENAKAEVLVEEAKELKHHLRQEEKIHTRIADDAKKLDHLLKLQEQDDVIEEVKALREDVAIAECEELQRCREAALQLQEKEANRRLQQYWDRQIREKADLAEYNRKQEEEYCRILAAVQDLECNVEALTRVAQKRKLLLRRDETEKLLQMRRIHKQKNMLEMLIEDKTIREYEFLRSELALAEEQRILLEYAPHLLPHFTPLLLDRLSKLSNCT